jgi:hypothetical protein
MRRDNERGEVPKALSEEGEPINILWYGDGGSGKTTDLATMAKFGKVWIANAESGLKARALRSHGIPIENIEIFPDPEAGEEITFDGIEAEWLRIREALHEDPDAYVGVGWDSVTEIQQTLKDLEMVRGQTKAARRGVERDPFTMDQDNWRTVNEQCRKLIRKFRDLPCHFGASALQRREQDNDGAVVYMPAVTPGLQNDLVGWVDVVCHTETIVVDGEEAFVGLLRNLGKYRGKDRFRMTPRRLVDPTHERITAYINGELTLETDELMQDLKARMEREREPAAASA